VAEAVALVASLYASLLNRPAWNAAGAVAFATHDLRRIRFCLDGQEGGEFVGAFMACRTRHGLNVFVQLFTASL
jgi:hypothetical protein